MTSCLGDVDFGQSQTIWPPVQSPSPLTCTCYIHLTHLAHSHLFLQSDPLRKLLLMLRHFDVSRLCRPARLRCRPALLFRPKSTSAPPPPDTTPATWSAAPARRLSTALASRPRPASTQKRSDDKTLLAEEAPSQMLRRRTEDRDYDQAKRLKEEGSPRTSSQHLFGLVVLCLLTPRDPQCSSQATPPISSGSSQLQAGRRIAIGSQEGVEVG